MKKLIVNGDDFGLSPDINKGIIKAFLEGALTSTSLMANGTAFDDGVLISKKYSNLSVGIHIVLIEEKPILPQEEVPSLIGNDNRLPKNYKIFLKKLLLKEISLKDIELEIKAQIEKILNSGVKISHIDSHQHLHMYPPILKIVIKLANEYNIHKIRVPYERQEGILINVKYNILSWLSKTGKKIITSAGLKTTDFFYGVRFSGSMTKDMLINILNNLPEGTSELMCHPGQESTFLTDIYGYWGFNWQQELDVLISKEIKNIILERKISLISYYDL